MAEERQMSRVPGSFAPFALTFALVALVATGVSAEARRALIVGINDYREIPPLQKAVGDANALKATLESLGFTVDLVLNADRRELNRAVSLFQSSLQPGDRRRLYHNSLRSMSARLSTPGGVASWRAGLGPSAAALDRLSDTDEEPNE
jgi:hypothetical protein